MGSVKESQAGIASGINNAVSRTAGLLAIAVLGVIMLQTFSSSFSTRLRDINIPQSERASLYGQRMKLAGLEVPQTLNNDARDQVEAAVATAFVSGLRVIMILAAVLALGSALIAWWRIEDKGR
jgi:hypothetical protein